MKLNPYMEQNTTYGKELKITLSNGRSVYFFFGNKNYTKEHFWDRFDYRSLHQVHGTDIVKSTEVNLIEADGHYTNESNVALCINTADCMPILLCSDEFVFAIHAGWRGLRDKILFKILPVLHENNINPKTMKAVIGPRILKNNFEVGLDVANELFNSLSGVVKDFKTQKKHVIFPHAAEEKRYVDLDFIAREQLLFLGIEKQNILFSKIDTFSNEAYNSYREDQTPTRNISFVAFV